MGAEKMNFKDDDQYGKGLHALYMLVTDFSFQMKMKLRTKFEQGKRGTDTADELRRLLANCILKYDCGKDPAQLVDIGNLAALLWRIEVQQ
jgi:hypothetical protein